MLEIVGSYKLHGRCHCFVPGERFFKKYLPKQFLQRNPKSIHKMWQTPLGVAPVDSDKIKIGKNAAPLTTFLLVSQTPSLNNSRAPALCSPVELWILNTARLFGPFILDNGVFENAPFEVGVRVVGPEF